MCVHIVFTVINIFIWNSETITQTSTTWKHNVDFNFNGKNKSSFCMQWAYNERRCYVYTLH